MAGCVFIQSYARPMSSFISVHDRCLFQSSCPSNARRLSSLKHCIHSILCKTFRASLLCIHPNNFRTNLKAFCLRSCAHRFSYAILMQNQLLCIIIKRGNSPRQIEPKCIDYYVRGKIQNNVNFCCSFNIRG